MKTNKVTKARKRKSTAPLAAAICSACGRPGVYIRTRHFERQQSHVWMCENETCKNNRLYWHTDFETATVENLQLAIDCINSVMERCTEQQKLHRKELDLAAVCLGVVKLNIETGMLR